MSKFPPRSKAVSLRPPTLKNYAEDRSRDRADSDSRPRIAPYPLIGRRCHGIGLVHAVLHDAIRGGQRNIPGSADFWDLGIRYVQDMPDQAIDAVGKLSELVGTPVPTKLIGGPLVVVNDPHRLILLGGAFSSLQVNIPTASQILLTQPPLAWDPGGL
jgi:hypothetical protein